MAGRSPARFIAPLALVAVGVALFMVVSSSLNESGGTGNAPDQTSGNGPTASPTPKGKRERKGPRRYRVKTGDTPSSIAEKTGVPLEEILRLNPDLDPQTLAPGQRIKLRE
ncbi:MAG TPA: LysM domain-containing protein [Solirubrobacteraceae bacterium]|nr:LysM domain-containing protein [Solirubrobacteraceae bacterium]